MPPSQARLPPCVSRRRIPLASAENTTDARSSTDPYAARGRVTQFQHFWAYRSFDAGRRFLDAWTRMAMRSRIEPMKKFARTLRDHERELLNWFLARGEFAAGATEGFNNKARITTRKAYGFRTYEHAEIALYHALGDLPEPDWLTHRFV